MTEKDLDKILSDALALQAENEIVEFKEAKNNYSFSEIGQYFSALSNEANLKGKPYAWLIFGVNDNHKIVGTKYRPDRKGLDSLKKELAERVTNKTSFIEIYELQKSEGRVIMFQIPAAPKGIPIEFNGFFYGRTNESLVGLSIEKIDRIRNQVQNKDWSAEIIPNAKIEDLSLIALQRFRNEAAKSGRVDEDVLNDTTEHLLQDLQLADEVSGKLKRAAVLLFHPKPEKFVEGAYVKIGFFQGDDDELAFQDVVQGSLMEQIDKTMDLLETKYTVFAIFYEGTSRREKPAFPISAMRESLMNAIAHKDYASGVPIQISVYPDRIVFWNPGHLPQPITVDNIFQKHPSIPHNPCIANALFRCGDIEAWGRGFRKIVRSVLEHKQLPPTVKNIGGLMLTYYTDKHTQMKESSTDERILQIVEYVITNKSITNSDVQKILNTSRQTATRLLGEATPWLTKQGERGKGTTYVLKWANLIDSQLTHN